MLKTSIAALLLTLTIAPQAKQIPWDEAKDGPRWMTPGTDWKEKCKAFDPSLGSTKSGYATMFVLGYVSGYMEANWLRNMVTEQKPNSRLSYEIPQGATKEQVIEVVVKWVKENPKHWHDPAAILIERALHDAFPPSK